tara:strand:- start:3486 stop:4499 length:1014 start_codon:yes stop_codon:yes gene_type:complete
MATYSGNQWLVYVGQHGANQGILTQNSDGTLYRMNLESVEDIDFSAGITQEFLPRTGQKVFRQTDVITTQNGGSYTWAFDYLVDSEEILQLLLRSAMEVDGTTGLISIAGTHAHSAQYAGGQAAPDFSLQVSLVNPDASETRLLHSAVVTELTLSMDMGTNGGRLRASGTMYSGFRPTVGVNAVVDGSTGSNTAFAFGMHDCHAVEIAQTQITSKSFSVTISNPCQRVGYAIVNSIDGEPEDYIRDRVDVTGSINVKMDDTSVAQLPFWLAGTSKAILVGDEGTAGGGSATNIFFEVAQAKYTGHNVDLGSEGGVFIELPFQGTATGSEKLISVKLT